MAIAIVGTPSRTTRAVSVGANEVVSDPITVTAGSLLVVCVSALSGSASISVTDTKSQTYVKDKASTPNANVDWQCEIWSFPNAASGSTTITAALGADVNAMMSVFELSGAATSSPVDGTPITANPTGSPSANYTTTANNSCIIAAMNEFNDAWTIDTTSTNLTMLTMQTIAGAGNHAAAYWTGLDTGSPGTKAVAFNVTGGVTGPYSTMAAVAYKVASAAGPSSYSKPLYPISFF